MPSIRLNVVWKQARIEKALKLYFTSFTHVESPQTQFGKFSAGRKLRVQIHAPEQEAAVMSCDGCSEENLFTGDVIDVALSDQTIELVCFNEADQFEAIDKKLKGR